MMNTLNNHYIKIIFKRHDVILLDRNTHHRQDKVTLNIINLYTKIWKDYG